MRMVVAGGWRTRVRERRVSHLALAIRMERLLTQSTWGSDARAPAESGELSSPWAQQMSRRRCWDATNETQSSVRARILNFTCFMKLFLKRVSQSALVKPSHLVSTVMTLDISDLLRKRLLEKDFFFLRVIFVVVIIHNGLYFEGIFL